MRTLAFLCAAAALTTLAAEPAPSKEGTKVRFVLGEMAPVARDIPAALDKKRAVAFTLLDAAQQEGFDRDTTLANVKATDGEAPKVGKCYRYIATGFVAGREAGTLYIDFLGEMKPGSKVTDVKRVGTFTADHDGEKGAKRVLYEGVVTPK